MIMHEAGLVRFAASVVVYALVVLLLAGCGAEVTPTPTAIAALNPTLLPTTGSTPAPSQATASVPIPTSAPLPSATATPPATRGGRAPFRLTVLHNNDGESKLFDAGKDLQDFGGVSRFATLVQGLKERSQEGTSGANLGVIMVSSGDNFLAGPNFDRSSPRHDEKPLR